MGGVGVGVEVGMGTGSECLSMRRNWSGGGSWERVVGVGEGGGRD